MKFDRTGIILYVLKYEECVDFYKEVLELQVLFTSTNLTCFKFGVSYLMVELDDEYQQVAIEQGERTRTCLRMNVSDVKGKADELVSKGITVDFQVHEWGTIAKFFDPDGNLCAFKDSDKFEKQLRA